MAPARIHSPRGCVRLAQVDKRHVSQSRGVDTQEPAVGEQTAPNDRVDSLGAHLRIDRRSFLVASGRAASVAGLAVLLDGAGPALAARSRSAGPSQRQWRMLARSLRGELVL